MNDQQLIATKNIHDGLKELLGAPYLQMAFMRKMPTSKLELKDLLFIEPLRFMLYVAEADGCISQRELNIINYITGNYLSMNDINSLIQSDRDYYIDSMPETPLMIQILCIVENEFYKNGEALENSVLDIAIKYFEALGLLIADADDYVSYRENQRIGSYIQLIKEYAEENTLSPFYGIES